MKKNGLKHRQLTFTQGRAFNEMAPKVERTSVTRSMISWGFVLFFGAWMFVMGIVVGRQTVPVDMEDTTVQEELAALGEKETLKEKVAMAREEEEALLRETDLEFYDALKRGGDSTQTRFAAPAEASETGGGIKKPLAVKNKTGMPALAEVNPEAAAANTSLVEKPASGDGVYAIQVASFIVAEDADRLVGRLREKGYPDARREDENVSGHGMRYRVKVGAFNTKADAEETLQRLRNRENYADAYVRRHR